MKKEFQFATMLRRYLLVIVWRHWYDRVFCFYKEEGNN